jgi:hypothetical protein
MRENSIRVASAWSPMSNAVPTKLQSNQNIDEVKRPPTMTAIGILNACM